jgi:hypothetical protein
MSELIPDSSPLYRHPEDLNRRDRLILDGIRYSVEITELAFRRLEETLKTISQFSGGTLSPGAFASTLADSWTIIDSVNRLRDLVRLLVRLRANEPDYVKEFISQTEVAWKMRDGVQHMGKKLDKLLSLKRPPWGTVSWVTLEEGYPTRGLIHLLIPGSFQRGRYPVPNPAGESFRAFQGLITLKAYGFSVRIVDLVQAVAVFITRFQTMLSKQFQDFPHAAAEVYIRMEFEFGPDSTQEPAEQGGG